ncbi:MAG: hypothetical protein ACR2QK_18105, partial [Acidimicrobiales bacterium]
MSDFPQGGGWWEASDGKWYAPELHPDYRAPDHEPPAHQPTDQSSDRPPDQPTDQSSPGPGPYQPPIGPPPGGGVADPRFEGFEPPSPGERLQDPGLQTPPGPGSGGGLPPHQRYPAVGSKKGSTGKIIAIVLGGIFLLMAGGCGLFIWTFRDEIADATIDFSDAVAVDDQGTCRVTGIDFGEDYEIDATLIATSATVDSHYLVDFEVVDQEGRT